MRGYGRLIHLSHQQIGARAVAGEVLAVSQFPISFNFAKHGACILLAHYEVSTEEEGSVEKELVVSDTGWQVLFLEKLVIVDTKI